MLRGDFHNHIDDDRVDGRFIKHSIGELIDHAALSGINVLSVTCHEGLPYDDSAIHYAADKGILLLRGMEATVGGQHVLLLNFREFPPGICTMEDVARCKDPGALVVAPHPFYPAGVAGGDILRAHRHVFDAVEFSGMYTALTPHFNRQARDFARTVGLPVMGNTDTHFLWQVGKTFTWIDAPANGPAVIEAMRHGRMEVATQPLRWVDVLRFIHGSQSKLSMSRDVLDYMRKILRRSRRAERAIRHASAAGTPGGAASPTVVG